jgi:phosphomethylpyrimidine synthase
MENGKTQVELAKNGVITRQMEVVASREGIDPDVIRTRVAEGSLVIMTRGSVSVAIGKGATTKVNVNIGTSSAMIDPKEELEKATCQWVGTSPQLDVPSTGIPPCL